MKQAISVFILAILVSPYLIPAFGQKGRVGSPKVVGKKQPEPRQSEIIAGPRSTQFESVGVYTDGSDVYLAWQMEAEVGNIGFNIYKTTKEGTTLLNPAKIVAGAAMHAREFPAYGESYSYFDPTGNPDAAYYIEAVSLNGPNVTTRQTYPQYVSDLKTVSGKSSAELASSESLQTPELVSSSLKYTKDLINEIEDGQQIADPVTHRSVISQPGVVRIGVRGLGIVRVTRAELAAGGFDVNTDASQWKLYVDGTEQAMIIGNNADYIEFYGKGLDLAETDTKVYYLLNSPSPGKRIASRVIRRNSSTVVTRGYDQTYIKKERTSFVDDVDNGDQENYFGRAIGAGVQTMNFDLSGIDTTKPTARVYLQFMGYSTGTHLVEITLNDTVLAPIPGPQGEISFGAEFDIPTSLLREGANALKMRAAGPADFLFFDVMNIDFSRKFVAIQNKLSFYTENYKTSKLSGFGSPTVRVFDVTRDGEPILMTNLVFENTGGSFGTDLPAARGRSFFATDNAGLLSAVSVTPNNPELVGIPGNGADLVIISYKDLMPQAETWATYRRGQGFTVKVIEVSELYDEFNYGTLGTAAVSSFLQYAYESWQNPPDYALLIGDASVDSRNYEGLGYWNQVPAKMVSAVFSETASDEALADFDDDGLSEIAIGRIASRDAAGITTVFNKVVNWETAGPSLDRGALFAYDHNIGYDFDRMSLDIRNQLPVSMPATMVYRGDVGANTTVLNSLNAGKYIVNYSGHGTTGSWGGNPVFFNISSVPTLDNNVNNPALFTMLTCLNGAYHYLHNESFAEVLTKSTNKGAVAAWASTGQTLANVQERMALRFYAKLAEGNIPRLGNLIRESKTVITIEDGGADVRRSWALIGDPMLKVR